MFSGLEVCGPLTPNLKVVYLKLPCSCKSSIFCIIQTLRINIDSPLKLIRRPNILTIHSDLEFFLPARFLFLTF